LTHVLLDFPNKKIIIFTIFLLAQQCAPAYPVHGGTHVYHPTEPLLPLRFHTRGQEGTNVPWNDEKVLQVEDANGAVRPSFDAFLFDTINEFIEASTTANCTTANYTSPIPLTLCSSIKLSTARRSSRFFPSTSFHSNSIGYQIHGISFRPSPNNKNIIQAFFASCMISSILTIRQNSFHFRLAKCHLPSPAQCHPLCLARSPTHSLAKSQPSLVKGHLPSPAKRYL
jgi:hypothetical protein